MEEHLITLTELKFAGHSFIQYLFIRLMRIERSPTRNQARSQHWGFNGEKE